jgi:hypothetical protein
VLIVSKASFNALTRFPLLFRPPAAETLPERLGLPFHWTVRDENDGIRCGQPRILIWTRETASVWNCDAIVNEVLARLEAILS